MLADYLQKIKDPLVTQIISEGLANTYIQQPSNPIKFLGEYILQQNWLQQEYNQLQQNKLKIKEEKKIYQEKIAAQEKLIKQQEEIRQQKINQEIEFQEFLQKQENINDLFWDSKYLDYVQEHFQLKNVYLIQLIKQENSNEQQVLQIFQSNKSNQNYVGQILPNDKNYLYELINQQEDESKEEENQNQFQLLTKKFKNFRFIEDVINPKNQVHFLQLPDLGQQVAMSFEINFYDNDESFSQGIQYFQQKQKQQQQNQANQENEENLSENQEQQKIEENQKDNNENDQNITKKTQQFILVLANLGMISQITESRVIQFLQYSINLVEVWNQRNYQNLEQNVQKFLEIQQNNQYEKFKEQLQEIQDNIQQYIRNFNNDKLNIEDWQQQEKMIFDVLEENQVVFKEKLKDYFIKKEQFLNYFNFFNNNFNIVKLYLNQNYFLQQKLISIYLNIIGYRKDEYFTKESNINFYVLQNQILSQIQDKTTSIVQQNISNNNILQDYQQIDNILNQLQEFDQDQLKQQNFICYIIYKFCIHYCNYQIESEKKNIILFKEYQNLKANLQNQEIQRQQQLQEQLNKAKQVQIEDDQPELNEEDFVNNFILKFPEIKQLNEISFIKNSLFSEEFYHQNL